MSRKEEEDSQTKGGREKGMEIPEKRTKVMTNG